MHIAGREGVNASPSLLDSEADFRSLTHSGAKLNLPFSLKINRTVVMSVIAVLLTALTLLDRLTVGDSSHPLNLTEPSVAHSPPVPRARGATEPAIGESTPIRAPVSAKTSSEPSAAILAWQNIRTLSLLNANAPTVTKRYQLLAAPYGEMIAAMAVLYDGDEKPEDAVRRAIPALLPPVVQIKALLIADGAVSTQGNTLLSVSLSLESADSQAIQQAVLALGNPAAGMVWRELTLIADSEKRLVSLSGLLSVLAVPYAE